MGQCASLFGGGIECCLPKCMGALGGGVRWAAAPPCDMAAIWRLLGRAIGGAVLFGASGQGGGASSFGEGI